MAYSVPHTGNIPFNLSDGKEIIVDGVVPPYAGRFSINLCSGQTYDSDTALHFNPRFDQNEVVRTHNRGGWGAEEKHGGFPFYKGGAFEVKIIVRHHAFQIFVNNTFFCDFNHRIPKETARFLYIAGDVTINRIAYLDVIQNPPVPLTTFINGGIYPGRKIVIDGIPRPGASRFNINLVCGPNFDANDVALHFDARFNYGDSHNTVVRTHKAGGGWGAEEKHCSYFPFVPNVPFEILILVESHGFKIAVNNQHFVEFNHRLHPLQRIDHLNVQGDVTLTQVKFV
ncbi:galectin-4-like [Physella acuta]|uniref:galectin-4-like n=1 Tax=Physella acuta TaxID=109671 RepID=UPI0027DD5BD5|nr:galectin-4-like [Physella acuta]